MLLAAASLILLLRKPDALLNPQFWAEDGVIFFIQQYNRGAAALFESYAGYLHLVPRLIALAADTFIPYRWTPTFYNYSCFLITLGVVMAMTSARLKISHKPLVALAIVLVPHPQNEVFLNVTNLQWILSLLTLSVLVKEAPDKRYGSLPAQYGVDLASLLVCGLTGPFIVLMLPLYLVKCALRPGWHSWLTAGAAAVTSLIQRLSIAALPNKVGEFVPDFSSYVAVIGRAVFGGYFVGYDNVSRINHYLLTVLGVATFLAILRCAARQKNAFAGASVYLCIVIVLAALYRLRHIPDVLLNASNGARYWYVPYVTFTWAMISTLGHRKGVRDCVLFPILALVLVMSWPDRFISQPFTDYHWQEYSESIGKKDVVIPINPEGFKVSVPAIRRG